MARHTAKSHKIRKVEILVIQTVICLSLPVVTIVIASLPLEVCTMYSIQETQDFYPLSLLYQERGLEVTPSHTPPQGTLFMLRCEDSETGELAAAATLQRRAGHFVLAHLAVASHLQGSGLGSQLLASAERHARQLGARELWLVGKVPGFYARYHWLTVPREMAPPISRCLTCPQFQVDCFPSIMKKELSFDV